MRLTVLGSCGTYPVAGRACSGYLLEAGGAKVWIDCGSGTVANLQRYCSLADLDAVWLSHLHIDHSSDLPVAYYALLFGPEPRDEPLPVYGPTGWAAHVERFLREDPGGLAETFDAHELEDGQVVRLGDLELEAVATVHGIETYALRASADGRVLGYTADSGPCGALVRLAAGADLLLSEAALGAPEGADGQIHLTPEQAAGAASEAGAAALMLTHLRPPADEGKWAERAAARFSGPISVALEGDAHEVGQSLETRSDDAT